MRSRAEASAERALLLDDTLSSVHVSFGGINILRRRWQDAETALRRATHLDPANADAHHWLALTLLTGFGDRAAAIREQSIAVQLDPVGGMPACALAWQQYLRGEYELSRLEMQPAAELNPDFEEGHTGLARVAARLGDETTMLTSIAAGLTRRADLRGDLLAEHASALAVLGDARRARRVAREASAHRAMPLNLALAWASVGDADRTFRYLERESLLVYWAPQVDDVCATPARRISLRSWRMQRGFTVSDRQPSLPPEWSESLQPVRDGQCPTLNALRHVTAPFHNLEYAKAAGYSLLTVPPLTAADGCISSAIDGGMGYHYTRGNNLADDSVTLLDPEFLVYAPKNGPDTDGEVKRRLAAFDYFIPYSVKWPGPDDPTFKRAPTLHDFSTMSDLPDIAFAPSRFGGWMFHIWLWERNPGGMFANWNTSVPLCEGSAF